MNVLKQLFKYILLYILFGGIYFIIECLWKHQLSDYRMFLLAGFLGVFIGLLNNLFSWDTAFILQCYVGTITATLSEAVLGIHLINQGIYIWDYSTLPLSACNGTINLFFSIAWLGLSAVCIVIDDYLRYWLFHEEKPKYRLI